MNATKIIGIFLIVAGTLGLVYQSFSYTKERSALKVGSLELTVKDKEVIAVPVWLGIGAIAVGGLLLVFGGRKS